MRLKVMVEQQRTYRVGHRRSNERLAWSGIRSRRGLRRPGSAEQSAVQLEERQGEGWIKGQEGCRFEAFDEGVISSFTERLLGIERRTAPESN